MSDRRSIFIISSSSLLPTKVTRIYAPTSLPSTTVGKTALPVKRAEESTMSRSMNSMDCASRFASFMAGTEAMAAAISAKGRMRLTSMSGFGMSLSVSSVIMPSVPSEPIIRCSRLYPELVLQTVLPSFIISPLGSTTVMAST